MNMTPFILGRARSSSAVAPFDRLRAMADTREPS